MVFFQNCSDILTINVNRDRYNIDAPGCKKKAYMGLDFRTLNGSESESILNSS